MRRIRVPILSSLCPWLPASVNTPYAQGLFFIEEVVIEVYLRIQFRDLCSVVCSEVRAKCFCTTPSSFQNHDVLVSPLLHINITQFDFQETQKTCKSGKTFWCNVAL